jgi:hypothetical protein
MDAKKNDMQETREFIQVWASMRIKTLRPVCIDIL